MLKRYIGSVSLLALVISGSALAADGLKVGGFVDAQIHHADDSAASEGFTVQDGAIYVTKEAGNGEVKIDIPFAATGASNFTLGAGKAQAYAGYKTDMGLKLKLGQFDSIYGFELNDAPDLTFSRQGLLYSAATPVVHAGLLASYEMAGLATLNLLVANPHDVNTMTSANPDQRTLDYGFQLTAAPANFRVAAGVLLGKRFSETESLFDFLAGATFGPIAIDAELALRKPPTTGTGVKMASGTAILAQAVYTATDMIAAGVRFEMVNKLCGAGAITAGTATCGGIPDTQTTDAKQMTLTVGPQFKLSDDLKLKADYGYLKDSQGATGTVVEDTQHIFTLAAVYKL